MTTLCPRMQSMLKDAVAERCRVPDVVDDQIGGYAEGTSQDLYSTTLSVT